MDIQVIYSDFNEVLKSAKIDLAPNKHIDIYFEDVTLNPGTPQQVIVKKLNVNYVDSDISNTIENKMDKNELKDYITLLQKAYNQM